MLSRDHDRPGQVCPLHHLLPGNPSQERNEEKQSTILGPKLTRGEVQAPHVRHLGRGGSGTLGPLLVAPSGKPLEAFFLQDQGDGRRTSLLSLLSLLGQGPANVVNREVLLAEGDDLLPRPIPRGTLRGPPGGEEELEAGMVVQLVAEDPEASGGVAKPLGRLGGGEALHEEGAEGLVLAMDKVLWFEEEGAEVC